MKLGGGYNKSCLDKGGWKLVKSFYQIIAKLSLTDAMKSTFKSAIRAACLSFSRAVCAGAILLMASSTQAQNLFVSDYFVGNIYEYTPGGAQSTFASGFDGSSGLAFDSEGDLFAAESYTGNIYEYTPGGAQSTFASGLNVPYALAFNSAGNLFEADDGGGNVYEFTPDGAQSTFASGLNEPWGLAFDSTGDLFVS